MGQILANNHATVSGTIAEELTFAYEYYGEKFYNSFIVSKRRSGAEDRIPITIPERICGFDKVSVGNFVSVTGTFRSFYKREDNKRHLYLTLFVETIEVFNTKIGEYVNEIHLDGYICKETLYRVTPRKREITEAFIDVNRNHQKSDFIPCISWGRNARFVGNLKVGDHISLDGRIQSREYQKKLENGEAETRTAYEVSAFRIILIEEMEE